MREERLDEILEAIWVCNEQERFSLAAVREICDHPFTDEDLEELERRDLIARSGEKIHFSRAGKLAAEGIIRRHRLAEVLVHGILKLSPDDMEEVACKVEHGLLPEVEQSICTLLGHPEQCPHGKPIPKGACCERGLRRVENVVIPLVELAPGESGRIAYLKPRDHAILHQMIAMGLQPGTEVKVHRCNPAYCLKIQEMELALDRELVEQIFVWRITEPVP